MDEPEALIFDCDGTLADTMPLHFIAWTAAMQNHGIEFSEERFYEMGGIPTKQIIEILAAEQSVQVDVEKATEEKEANFLRVHEQVQPIEPIVAIAREHRSKLPMGVASGSSNSILRQTLTRLEIIDWFDCLVGSEDTNRHKPEPDVFLRAAELLEVAPEKCRVYEDTDIGIEAARRAGMLWFDVRTVHNPRS